MPVLKNHKQELFAQLVASRDGKKTIEQCHVEAGYDRCSTNASRLLARPHVAARVQEIREAVASKAIENMAATTAKIVAELEKIAYVNITDVVRWGVIYDAEPTDDDPDRSGAYEPAKDVQVISSDDIPPEVSACIKSVRRTREGVVVEFYDKLAALEKLGRYVGMFRDQPSSAPQTTVQVGVQISSGVLAEYDRNA